jgi:hypothetical protein
MLDGKTMPSAAPGVEGGLGWAIRFSTWRVRSMVLGSFFPPVKAFARTGPPGEGGSFDLLSLATHICATAVRGSLEVGPCLGAELDVMTATGIGNGAPPTYKPSTSTGLWGTGAGSVLAAWNPSRHVGVFVRADGLVSPSPPTFGLLPGHVPVHTPSSLGARAVLGMEVRFF